MPQFIDLAGLQLQNRQLQQQKQQQQMANVMAMIEAYQRQKQYGTEEEWKQKQFGLEQRKLGIEREKLRQPKLEEIFNAAMFAPDKPTQDYYLNMYKSMLRTKYGSPNIPTQPTQQEPTLEELEAEAIKRQGGG